MWEAVAAEVSAVALGAWQALHQAVTNPEHSQPVTITGFGYIDRSSGQDRLTPFPDGANTLGFTIHPAVNAPPTTRIHIRGTIHGPTITVHDARPSPSQTDIHPADIPGLALLTAQDCLKSAAELDAQPWFNDLAIGTVNDIDPTGLEYGTIVLMKYLVPEAITWLHQQPSGTAQLWPLVWPEMTEPTFPAVSPSPIPPRFPGYTRSSAGCVLEAADATVEFLKGSPDA